MKVALVLAFALLTGCATSPHVTAWEHIDKGELTTAEPLLKQALAQGDMRAWNSLGVVYMRSGDKAKAIQYYNMGARWGDSYSQQNLADLGLPVPAADLAAAKAQQTSADAANTAATMQLLQTLQPRPILAPPQSLNCTSRRIGNSVQTHCF